ncbi:unnamed protein product, partial [Dibothriocephalus latus]
MASTLTESGSGSAASLSSLPPPCPSPSGSLSVETRDRAIQVSTSFNLAACGSACTDCLLCGRSLTDRGTSVDLVSPSATVGEPLTTKPASMPSTPTLQRARPPSVPDKDAYSAVLAAICRRVDQFPSVVSPADFQLPCRLIPPGLLEGRQSQCDDGPSTPTEGTENPTGRLENSFFSTSSTASVSNRFGSSWKPFWTTLVTIVGWRSVFIIYFEATTRNPVHRQDFSDSICQVQSFTRNPHQLASHPDAAHAPDADLPSVGLARHRNGSIDESSFLLAHPTVKKTYRLRPIFPKAPPIRKQTQQKEVGSPCGTPGAG